MPKRFFIISISLAVLALPVGFLGWLSDRTENSQAEIAQAERCLDQTKTIVDAWVLAWDLANRGKPRTRFVLNPTHQSLLTECLKDLTYRNQDIGKSKFVARTGVLVDQWYTYDPSDGRDWGEKEWSTSYAEASGIALVSAAGTFVVTLAGLLLLRWAWSFLLERIRELSNAIRGE